MNTSATARRSLSALLTVGMMSSTLALGIFPLPALATRPANCQQRNVFKLSSRSGRVYCYADPGTLAVNLPNVTGGNTGNYYGSVRGYVGSRPVNIYFCRKSLPWTITPPINVRSISLSATPPRQCLTSYQLQSGEQRF